MTAATNQTPIDCHQTVWFHNACGPSTDTDVSRQCQRSDRAHQM